MLSSWPLDRDGLSSTCVRRRGNALSGPNASSAKPSRLRPPGLGAPSILRARDRSVADASEKRDGARLGPRETTLSAEGASANCWGDEISRGGAAPLASRSLLPISLRRPETRLLLFLVCLRTSGAVTVGDSAATGVDQNVACAAVGLAMLALFLVGLPGTPLILAVAMRLPRGEAVPWSSESPMPKS